MSLNFLVPAAAVVLVRPGHPDPEFYLVLRSPRLRFLGGFHAFPGGKVEAEDGSDRAAAVRRAARRELFEETGILLPDRTDGTPLPSSADLADRRRRLLDGSGSFDDLITDLSLSLNVHSLQEVGRLVTPPFSPQRFDTAFFLADLPEGQDPVIWPGELESGRWLSARAALDAWNRGELLLSPPTVALLLELAGKSRAELPATCREATRRIEAQSTQPLWFSPGLRMLPLRAPALPPATFTNAFLVGTGPRYLIDPGPTDAQEQERLFAILDAEPVPLTAVLLTHHHIDHVGAAQAVAERYRVPVWAHADAARRLRDQVVVHRHLEDGCRIELGESPRGGSWHMVGLLTPGHAPGHLVFYLPDYGVLLAADIVSTLSSVLVAPPDGDLAQYLDSLRRLLVLPLRLLLPSHGGPSSRPNDLLQDALEHRALREAQLLNALALGKRTLNELVPEVYRGVPAELWPLAELQLLGNLLKLEQENCVVRPGDDLKGPWSVNENNRVG